MIRLGGTNVSVGTELAGAPSGSYATASLIPIPTCTVDASGGSNLSTHANSGPHSLPVGDYGDVKFGTGNEVIFEGGVYSFQSLYFGANTQIAINGPVILQIKNGLSFGSGVRQTLASGVMPADVVYLLASAASADTDDRLDVNSRLYGTFCSPNGATHIQNGTTLEGALYGNTVTVGVNAKIISSPADLSTLP